MALREELERAGNWFFRWRSYLPLLLIVVVLASFWEARHLHEGRACGAAWEAVCLLVSFVGLGLRMYTVGYAPGGTSGRSTRCPEAAVLNTTGIYSAVRHPLYLGNFLIWIGVSMFVRLWWVTLVFALVFWCYYEKIMLAEEAFLREKFGAEFERWANETPAFFPRFKNWKPPSLAFSWRTALRREYSAFLGIILAFTFLEVVGDLFWRRRLTLDWAWGVLLATGLVVYFVLRFLKRKTKVLSAEGR